MDEVERGKLKYLSAVNELGQRDISVMAKDVNILEIRMSSVLELNAKEVADIRGRTTAKFNSDGRGVVGCVRYLVPGVGHVTIKTHACLSIRGVPS
jgi:hypothetical protein